MIERRKVPVPPALLGKFGEVLAAYVEAPPGVTPTGGQGS
jgi:hypothetical protein